MKKRYVKRLIRKVALFISSIVVLSIITTKIVEKRIAEEKKIDPKAEEILDPNGEPTTRPYSALYEVKTPRRPRPPIQIHEVFYVQSTPAPPEVLDYTFLNKHFEDFDLKRPEGPIKDWEDRDAIERDRLRVGFGEHGVAVYLEDESQRELERNMSLQNGFNALISDSISVNRSVPDVRRDRCKTLKYLASLPDVSIVIPFYNEHFSVLIRSLYSIVNRTPKELLKEIIIVDDFSDRETLKEQLDDFVGEYFKDIVKIVRLSKRTGLIGARLAGAKQATGKVLVFFDSHIECNYNWLPPLIEPIAINPKICTCPIVDVIEHGTFAYSGGYQNGYRGVFDWNMLYKHLPLLPEDMEDETRPYMNPVMVGGLFAIGREFFWQLGGYDEELDIWGAEQYELSFKVWLCGGMLIDIPCSRVAHIFRGPMAERPSPRNYNFVARNHKRVAEVWMDEYKEYIYMRNPSAYENLDAGNLSAPKAIREKLHCKPFKYFLEVVAPDLVKQFPLVEPLPYVEGVVESLGFPNFCLDTMNRGNHQPVGLFSCATNKTHPQPSQHWALGHHRDLKLGHNGNICLDVQDSHENATVWMWNCHGSGGNQFWYYDRHNQWLVHGRHGNKCLEAIIDGDHRAVYTNLCDPLNPRMKWLIGKVRDDLLDNFFKDLP